MSLDLSSLSFLTTPARDLPGSFAAGLCLWVFIVGSTIGSFLNVVIGRVPEGLSVVKPRSRCPKCETQIAWYDNIPIASWLILRGKCRSCSTSISPRYIFIEFLVGMMAVAITLRYGLSLRGIELFFLACVLVCIAFIDLDTWTIPLSLLGWAAAIPLVAAGFAYMWPAAIPASLDGGTADATAALMTRLIGGGGGVVFLGAMVVVATYYARKVGRIGDDEVALGWGDPLLFGAIGLVVGWQLMPLVLLLASIQGIMAYPIAKFARPNTEGAAPAEPSADDDTVRGDEGGLTGADPTADEEWEPPESAIAWGPFLALAGLEVSFFAQPLLQWTRQWIMGGGF